MSRVDKVNVNTRKKIISAALIIAAQDGFASATTKEIAGKAKCSEGTIYHYFESKHELFLAVIKENAEVFLGLLRAQVEGMPGAKEKLERLIDFHFYYFTGKINIFQILFGKSSDATVPFPYVLKTVILPYQQIIEGIIRQGIDSGEFQKVDPVIVATSLLGMMQFNIIKMHFGVSEITVREIKSSIKQLIFKTLLRIEQYA